MNRGDSSESTGQHSARLNKKFGTKTVGGVVVIVFVAAYSFVRPVLNERMGWDLPALRQGSNGQIVSDSGSTGDRSLVPDATPASSAPGTTSTSSKSATVSKTRNSETAKSTVQEKPKATSGAKTETKTGPSSSKRGPLADRVRASKGGDSKSPRGPPAASQDDQELLYGLLREIGRDRYISPAGLQYGPGSAEGHRLEHLRRHTKDIPGRPVHGVFDGEMEGALRTIDQAYEKAKKGIRTTKKVDDGRTIYTVDMGKRIGFSGGRSGSQKRNPMARRVRLVVEGTYVITAYPL